MWFKNLRHTPGPWIVDCSSDLRRWGYVRSQFEGQKGEDKAVARVTRSAFDIEQSTANLHLIGAAPDLLAAAIEVLERLSVSAFDLDEECQILEKAILKTRGRK